MKTYLKKTKRKRENMEKIDIICLKKRGKNLKNTKKNVKKKYREAKNSKHNNE